MLVVGLTGGIASGKSTVAREFAELGVPIIDTDVIARDLVLPGKPALKEITARFGADILLPDGNLNRQRLRETIFADAEAKTWLEQLLHPLIREETRVQVQALNAPYCIVAIPLLAESAPNPLIQRVLLVDAPTSAQLERLQQRDNVTPELAQAMLDAQASREARLALASEIIVNDRDTDHLQSAVADLHQQYTEKSHLYQ